jgi:hypothetical protein
MNTLKKLVQRNLEKHSSFHFMSQQRSLANSLSGLRSFANSLGWIP